MKFFVLVACVTVQIMCSGINAIFCILNNILEFLKRCGEYVRWCISSRCRRSEFMLIKRMLSIMSIERLAQ